MNEPSYFKDGLVRLLVATVGQEVAPDITSAVLALPTSEERKKYLTEVLGQSPELLELFSATKKSVKKQEQKSKMRSVPRQASASEKQACGCMGTRHLCVGSCIECGRIVCKEEAQYVLGEACLHCGKSSCYSSLQATDLSTSSLGGEQITAENFSAYLKAYSNKDRLLKFDGENAKRTHVHDAQADYYESAAWLTDEERIKIDTKRQKARDAKLPSNRRYQMSLDFAGRRKIVAITSVAEEDVDKETGNEEDDEEMAKEEGVPLSVNAGLEGSHEKAGHIYRMLTESLAPWRGPKSAVEF